MRVHCIILSIFQFMFESFHSEVCDLKQPRSPGWHGDHCDSDHWRIACAQ